MTKHKYILEPYKGMNTRYRCPECQQREKTFSLYIDTEKGEHIHPSVGRCNRESNCGYHYTPKQYFQDNPEKIGTSIISFDKSLFPVSTFLKSREQETPQKPVSFIPVEVFKASLKGLNNFVKFLIDLFGVEVASELVSRYFIATSKLWNGATVFWQIDTQCKVRTGKIMLYNPTTGKRVKEPFNYITWVHKALKTPEFELKQCLFGEHLLIDKTNPVAIVESEKTAVIASVYLPQFIWVAVGSLTNLNAEKCSILKGRTVILFPDLNGFEKWSNKAAELSHLASFQVSDLLEHNATEAERKQGFDLADYLIKFDWRLFKKTKPIGIEIYEKCEPLKKTLFSQLVTMESENRGESQLFLSDQERLDQVQEIINRSLQERVIQIKSEPEQTEFDKEVAEIEAYFSQITIPIGPIRLNEWSTIQNPDLFIKSHLRALKSYLAGRLSRIDLNHLFDLKNYLQGME